METGIDYDTKFIGLKPDENNKSIIELLDEEKKNGYSDMSDDDISRLIKYKEHVAANEREAELKIDAANKEVERAQMMLEENMKELSKMFSNVYGTTVVFEEVGDSIGEEA